MIEGNLYKVTYLLMSGNGRWYRWEMTAVYLGLDRTGTYSTFSLRPLLGSTTLRSHDIEKFELVEKNVPHKYRDGVRDRAVPIKLPRRFAGAVERVA